MIDRITANLGRRLYETPVGFKFFVDALLKGELGLVGEESAGAALLAPRRVRLGHGQGRNDRCAALAEITPPRAAILAKSTAS